MSIILNGFARGELKLFELGENTRAELDFEYSLHRHWMQNIACLVSRFGFPSIAFDHGLSHIKEQIEKDNLAAKDAKGAKKSII